jgi:CO/xanthine dehydrogenase FAD-binding subunit
VRPRYDYLRPCTLEEARRLKSEIAGSRFIAGGTDLLVRIDDGQERPGALISLRSLPELVGVETNGVTRIGSMTVLTDLLEHRELCNRYPVLRQAVAAIGSVQIRNAATLGGNLCNASPCADGAAALLALDARLRIRGPGGERDVAIDTFFAGYRETCLRPDEVLTAVLVDPPARGSRGVFLKKCRLERDLALASVAVCLELDDGGTTCRTARLAAGSVAPTPLRLKQVEALLEGRRLTPDVLAQAGDLARQSVAPVSDVRASADYRRHLTGVLTRRAVETLLGRRPA